MEAQDQYYPLIEGDSVTVGISVRDKLAESAMIGLLSQSFTTFGGQMDGEQIAKTSYDLADAMIKQSKI